jgi:hypothetical protein
VLEQSQIEEREEYCPAGYEEDKMGTITFGSVAFIIVGIEFGSQPPRDGELRIKKLE